MAVGCRLVHSVVCGCCEPWHGAVGCKLGRVAVVRMLVNNIVGRRFGYGEVGVRLALGIVAVGWAAGCRLGCSAAGWRLLGGVGVCGFGTEAAVLRYALV